MFSLDRRGFGLLAALAGVSLLAASFALAAPPDGKGKPPNDDPPPAPLPPIKYRIQYFDTPNSAGSKYANGMNNLGQAVGWYIREDGDKRAYLYDPAIDLDSAVDLNDIAPAPEGWVISSGVGLNDSGLVVGSIELIDNRAVRRGFLLNRAADPPTIEFLPAMPGEQFSSAHDVNENGDVTGVYRRADGTDDVFLYNSGVYDPLDEDLNVLGAVLGQPAVQLNNPTATRSAQIAGVLADGTFFRWSPFEPLETFAYENWRHWPRGLNDSGTFCGRSWVAAKGNKGYSLPFRYNTEPEYLTDAEWSSPEAINSSGDLCGWFTGNSEYTPWVYHDDWGSINPADLVTGSDADLALWDSATSVSVTKINDRDPATDFGQLRGSLRFNDDSTLFFILTPEPAP